MNPNPFSSSSPVSDSNLFVGRADLLENFEAVFRSTLFVGEVGIGKTSLLLRLNEHLEEPSLFQGKLIPIYLDLDNPHFQEPSRILTYIENRVAKESSFELDTESPLSSQAGSHRLLEFLLQMELEGHKSRIILLIDNIEQNRSFRRRNAQFYAALRQLLVHCPPSNSVTIAATSTSAFIDIESSEVISPLLERLQVLYLSALAPEDCQELLHRTRALFPKGTDIDMLSRLLYRETGGHPSLVQECLSRCIRDRHLFETPLISLGSAAESLSTNGAPFFREYLSQLTLEDQTFLMALSLELPPDEWNVTDLTIKRFIAAGLITTEISHGTINPSCKIFFTWLRKNARKLVQVSGRFLSHVSDVSSISDLLARTVTTAFGARTPKSEREVQDVVQAILAAHELDFKREKGRSVLKGKTFIPDFSLENLSLAIEIKLLKESGNIGKIVDQILADSKGYKARYESIIFFVYDLSGVAFEHPFFIHREDPEILPVVAGPITEQAE